LFFYPSADLICMLFIYSFQAPIYKYIWVCIGFIHSWSFDSFMRSIYF